MLLPRQIGANKIRQQPATRNSQLAIHPQAQPIPFQAQSIRSQAYPIRFQAQAIRFQGNPIRSQAQSIRSQAQAIRSQATPIRTKHHHFSTCSFQKTPHKTLKLTRLTQFLKKNNHKNKHHTSCLIK